MEQSSIEKTRQKALNKPVYFVIAFAVCVLISFLVLWLYQSRYDILHLKVKIQLLTYFSDAFFTAGVIVGGVGALVLISGEGFFDIITYGVSMIVQGFAPKSKRSHEKYIDYKQRKEAEREDGRIWFLAAVGGFFIVVALCLSIPFFNPSAKKIDKGYEACKLAITEFNFDTVTEESYDYLYISYCDVSPDYNGSIFYKMNYVTESGTTTFYMNYNKKTYIVSSVTEEIYNQFMSYFTDGYSSGTRGTVTK